MLMVFQRIESPAQVDRPEQLVRPDLLRPDKMDVGGSRQRQVQFARQCRQPA